MQDGPPSLRLRGLFFPLTPPLRFAIITFGD
jgi:hypothetical protein